MGLLYLPTLVTENAEEDERQRTMLEVLGSKTVPHNHYMDRLVEKDFNYSMTHFCSASSRATLYCYHIIGLRKNSVHAADQLLTETVIYSRKIVLYIAQ
jgi:hypothetical protein